MDHSAALAIAGLWALFLGSHVGLSSRRLRPWLVDRLTPGGYLGVYSLLALALFVPLVWIYATNKHAGAFLWYGSTLPGLRTVVYAFMALALTLVVGSFLNPSPASIAPGSLEPRGMLRITRHPLFMGVGLFGVLHLLVARIHTSDLAFFGGLPLVALIGCWHQDRRKLASEGEPFRRFYEETSFLPFGAGRVRALIDPPTALLLGIVLTVVLRFLHPRLFGGAP